MPVHKITLPFDKFYQKKANLSNKFSTLKHSMCDIVLLIFTKYLTCSSFYDKIINRLNYEPLHGG